MKVVDLAGVLLTFDQIATTNINAFYKFFYEIDPHKVVYRWEVEGKLLSEVYTNKNVCAMRAFNLPLSTK